jgi:PHD/YefM family antitoxin component YafN of YafNO toxin-antitoxin module
MNATQVRREAKRRLDALSDERLPAANDFLAYLEERESNEATEEMLRVPGILERLKEAEKQIAAGRTVPVSKLRREVYR